MLYAILLFPAYFVLSLSILWVMYLAVMHLREARDAGKLSKESASLGMIVLAIGYLWDGWVNFTTMTVLFVEFPKETTVTARLSRHIKGEGWRKRVATWFCRELLNDFDPSGCHCK